MSNITKDQVFDAVMVIKAVAEAIREAGSIPSGELYAILMPTGVTLEGYTKIIDTLKRAELVTETNHLLTWVGPKLEEPLPALTPKQHGAFPNGRWS